MAKKHIINWNIEIPPAGADTQQVKVRALGTIEVMKPSALENTEFSVAGILSAERKTFTGNKAAVLNTVDGKKADVLSRLPFSALIGYLPTTVEGTYIAVCRQHGFPILLPVVLSAVLLTVGLVFLPHQTAEKSVSEEKSNESGTVLELETNVSDTAKTADEIREEKPNVTLPGWGSLTIAADSTTVCVNFINPEKNAGYYYLTFELLLKNGDETESLYQSGLVEPGKYVTDITLSRPLSAGEYDAVVHMQPYTMSDPPTATNSGDVAIKLIVQ